MSRTPARSRGAARPVLARVVSRWRSNASPSAVRSSAQALLVAQLLDGIQASLDGSAFGQGRQDPFLQEPGPHGGHSAVQDGEQ